MSSASRFGIATYLDGVKYRSRLEARWAALFTFLGWRFEYEPIDLVLYQPDYLIYPGACGGQAALLAEVRPSFGADWAQAARDKIAASGWLGRSVVLGSTIDSVDAWAHCGECAGTTIAHPESGQCLRCGSPDHTTPLAPGAPGLVTLWIESGNRVQWKAPTAPCARCGLPDADFSHRLGCQG